MAVFDPQACKIVVRVIYDGPGLAGKTTNLQQLCCFFTTFRRSELYSPAGLQGRTLYFDWLQIDSGLVTGRPLRSHFITVPGQTVLARRRFHLLGLADVVVFVVESTERGAAEAKPMFDILQLFLQTRKLDAPIVVQANKQDLPGALGTDALAERLALQSEIPIVSAQAEVGVGVRETAVLAIRAAADKVQHKIRESGITALEGEAFDGEQLRGRLEQLEREQPMSPAEVIRSQGQAHLPAPAGSAIVADSPSEQPAEAPVTPASAPPEANEPSAQEESASAPDRRKGGPATLSVEDVKRRPPPLPSPDVASGFIWPATTGRDILRSIPMDNAVLRDDLTGQLGTIDGSGRSDAFIFRAGDWCLKTSAQRCFEDTDEGRTALLRLARLKLQLGSLLPADTVLSLRRITGQGQIWLWTVTPWLITLRSRMTAAVQDRDEAALTQALGIYAAVAVESAQLTARKGLLLDVHPSNFAMGGDSVHYIDDDIGLGTHAPALGYSLLRRIDEYAEFPQAVQQYTEHLAGLIGDSLSSDEAEALDLEGSVRDARARSTLAQSAKERLHRVIQGLPRSGDSECA